MPEEYKEIIPLTDPVTPPDNSTTSLTDPVVEDISKQPPQEPVVEDTPPPAVAATPPKTSRNLFTIPLIIIAILAVIATILFYNQTQQLKQEVQNLTTSMEEKKAVPTPTPTLEITPEATPSAIPQLETETQQALTAAQVKYPDAQLILITSNNPHLEDQKVTKYWFRQAPELKQYLYISSIADELTLVDQQTYVSPDNDIPSLNKRLKENGLGLTITEVLSLTSALCEQPEFCQQATTVKAQFLDTSTNLLWQVTYQIEDQVEPLVFQVDSLTKEVVYQSQK
jgi:hypothetical protein